MEVGGAQGEQSRTDEERRRLKCQIVASSAICFVFAIVGFFNQGPNGAAGFALAALLASVIFIPCLADECSLFGSTFIVCSVFGGIGTFVGGINGLFYGVGFAFAVCVPVFYFLSMLEHYQVRSRDRHAVFTPEMDGRFGAPRQLGARSPSWSERETIADSAELRGMREAVEETQKQGMDSSLKAPARSPTPSEAEVIVDRDQLAAMQELLEKRKGESSSLAGGRSPVTSRRHDKFFTYPTAAALVMSRAAKRLGVKYGDFGLVKAAKSLGRTGADAALKARRPVLSRTFPRKVDDALGCQPKSTLLEMEGTMDPLAVRFAEEHKRFLEATTPTSYASKATRPAISLRWGAKRRSVGNT